LKSARQKDAKALVRRLLAEGMVDKNIGKTIDYGGEQIHISNEEGAIRIDLIGTQKAFVLKSNRLYRRDFKPPESTSKQQFHKQLNYLGVIEEVDAKAHSNKVACRCGNVRWVKNADLFQVKKMQALHLPRKKGKTQT
jgi:hypothetical protein